VVLGQHHKGVFLHAGVVPGAKGGQPSENAVPAG
jgi:hypothetical protein